MADGRDLPSVNAAKAGLVVLPAGTELGDLTSPLLKDLIIRRAEKMGGSGHWIWDERSGRCLYCSEELASIHELTVADYMRLRGTNQQVYAAIHPEDREAYRVFSELSFAQCRSYEYEFRIFTSSGKIRHCYEAAETLVDEAGNYVGTIGIVQDVTETKRIEAELRASKDTLAQVFDAVSLPIFAVDSSCSVTLWNRAAERVFGWSAKEVMGQPLPLDPDCGCDGQLAFLRSQVNRPGQPQEASWRRKDGSSIPVGVSCGQLGDGGAGAVAVIAVDLSGQKAAERTIQESREQLRFAFEKLPLPLIITRLADGTVLYANDSAREVFALEAGVSNMRTGDYYWSEEERQRYRRALLSGQRVSGLEICYKRADGRPYIAAATAERITFGGEAANIGIALDLSEQRRVAEELRHAQRLEAVGHLTGGVAHDFNNLLTVILGNAEALAADSSLPGGIRDQATAIVETAARGASLTRQLLAFARRQSLHPVAVDANALIANLCRLLGRTLPSDIELVSRLDPALPLALVDRAQLETAILNLVLNARDALPEGGQIAIETHSKDVQGAAPGQVFIQVADDGRGMTPEVLARAFEPFFTTKEVGHGSGLGLSMVYGFAAQSGGSVHIDSTPDVGTRVRLQLVAAPEPAPVPEVSDEAQHAAKGKERILLVEDEPLVREYVVAQLQHLGYAVTAAANGVSALELLRGEQAFDLLLTDLIMPGGVSGRKLRRQARVMRPGLRVLTISGFSGEVPAAYAAEDATYPILRKPFNRRDLAQAVRTVLEAPAR